MNEIKQRAREEVEKYGACLAYHYQAYNMRWDGEENSAYDIALLRELGKYVKIRG